MKKINTDHLKELAETMDLIAQHQLDKASQIYYCVVKSVDDNQCTIAFNNKQYTVPYYGGKPTPNKTYAIFLPHNNMNESFVIGDGKDGGIGEEVVPISKGGTGADNAADARANLGIENTIVISDTQPTGDELVWIDTDDDGSVHQVLELSDFDSASGHCKMPDGTLIQWGSLIVEQGSTAQYVGQTYQMPVSISLPIPFVDTNYRVFGSSKFVSGEAVAIGHDVSLSTESSAYIRAWDYTHRTLSSSETLKIWWIAIGRWR